MIPLVDTHVHLLAGRDDGPATPDEAVAMCRMLVAEGANVATALAHQNDDYPDNTPAALRAAHARLVADLAAAGVPLAVYPTAEVMLATDLLDRWHAGGLLSMADRGQYLLVEMPHGLFLDIRMLAADFRRLGVRLVVAHAERYPELLHDPGLTEQLINLGCLIQVTARGLTHPVTSADARALREWVARGMVHLLGSDGHGLDRRQPRLRDGYAVLKKWAGEQTADRIGGIWGSAVVQGLPVHVPRPQPAKRTWFAKLFGG